MFIKCLIEIIGNHFYIYCNDLKYHCLCEFISPVGVNIKMYCIVSEIRFLLCCGGQFTNTKFDMIHVVFDIAEFVRNY